MKSQVNLMQQFINLILRPVGNRKLEQRAVLDPISLQNRSVSGCAMGDHLHFCLLTDGLAHNKAKEDEFPVKAHGSREGSDDDAWRNEWEGFGGRPGICQLWRWNVLLLASFPLC